MKFAFSVLLASFFALNSFAQESKVHLGLAVAPSYFGKNPSTYATCVNFFGGISAEDQFGLSFGISTNTSSAKRNQIGDLKTYESLSVTIVNLEGQFNFGKANSYKSGIYIPIGVSYLIGNYNYQERSSTSNINFSEELDGLNLDLGLGYYHKLNKITLFSDLRIGIPITTNNQTQFLDEFASYVSTPFQTILKVGVRFPIKFIRGNIPFGN